MKLVVIGSGIGGTTVAEEFARMDSESQVTLISEDKWGYYFRPLLSHGFYKTNIDEQLFFRPAGKENLKNLSSLLGVRGICIDVGVFNEERKN